MSSISRNTVWIIDDSLVNQRILTRMLQDRYQVRCTFDAGKALQKMKQNLAEIAAIILNIHVSGYSGIDFLKKCRIDNNYSGIPILVSSSDKQHWIEKQCLELGAVDFISSPYDVGIVRMRLENVIQRSWFHNNDNDQLTGVYTKEKFQRETEILLKQNPETQFVLVSVDIDNFKTYNNFFGVEEGDHLLQFLGLVISSSLVDEQMARYARYAADFFLIMAPYSEEKLQRFVKRTITKLKQFNSNYNIKPSIGVYVIEDSSIPLEIMQNRVAMAAAPCKRNYEQFVGYYDKSMGERILREQNVMNRIDSALQNHEFVVYYQPKYALSSGKPSGAEALVRWQNEDGTIMMPGDFIPTLEKNGYIGNLDYYVWDEVCRMQRKWLDDGINPMPVSVNVSLINLYNPQFVDVICNLCAKYQLQPRMLDLEFTESAFFESTEMISDVIRRLQEKGFRIFLDDFGKGSASLNMLKTLPVDLLKIDMHLLPLNPAADRGGKILAAIIRMTEWLQIPVVVEGAENADQISFLRDNNCDYVQGFYFSRPIPQQQYEAMLREGCKCAKMPNYNGDRRMMTEIWASDALVNRLFESILEPLIVLESQGGRTEIIRANNVFTQKFIRNGNLSGLNGKLEDYMEEDIKTQVHAALQKASNEKGSSECEFPVSKEAAKRSGFLMDREKLWLHLKIQYIEKCGDQEIFTCVVSDTTTTRKAMEELDHTRNEAMHQEQLALIALRMSGIFAWEYDIENHCAYQLKGMKHMKGISNVVRNFPDCVEKLGIVYPDDLDGFMRMIARVEQGSAEEEGCFRIRLRDKNAEYDTLHVKYIAIPETDGKTRRAVGVVMYS